jgi:hypothetical protein
LEIFSPHNPPSLLRRKLAFAVLHGDAAHRLTSNDQLHVPAAPSPISNPMTSRMRCLVRRVHRPTIVAEGEQALMDDVESRLRPHPFHHRRLGGVRLARIA